MEELIDQQLSSRKFFKEHSIGFISFFGGPLATGYAFAENFKALNEPEKVTRTWLITIVSSILIFIGIFLIPENLNIPNQVIPITFTVIAYGLFRGYQEEKINTYIENGGEAYGWGKVIGTSLVGFAITLSLIFGAAFAYGAFLEANYTSKIYGQEVQHQVRFNHTTVSEEEADNIAMGFFEMGFFDLTTSKEVSVERNANMLQISIPLVEEVINNADVIEGCTNMRNFLDDYLPNDEVELRLVIDSWDNVVRTLNRE